MLNKTDVLRRINHFWEAKSQRGKEQIFEDILDYRVYVPKHFWIDLIEANLEPFSKIVLFDEKLVSALDVESKLINFLSDPCHINRRKASKRLIGDQSGKALKAFTNRLEKETDKVVIGSLLSAISYFSKETSLYYILKNYSNVNSIDIQIEYIKIFGKMKFSEVTKNILIEIIKDDKSNLYLKYVAVFSLFDYQGQDIELMLLNLFCNSKDNNIRYAAYFSLIYRDSLIAEHACILGLSKKYGSTYIEEALAKLLKTQTSRNQDILICSLSRIPDKYYQKIFEMIKKENLIHANTELYHLYFTCKDHVYKSEIVKILSSFGDKKSKEYLLKIKTTGKEQNFLKNRMVVRFSE